MFTGKQKEEKITINIEIEKTLDDWLETDIKIFSSIFSLSARVYNGLRSIGVEKLGDILLFTKESLHDGCGITRDELRRFGQKEKSRACEINRNMTGTKILDLEPGKYRRGVGEKTLNEIEAMLTHLGIKLRTRQN